MTATMTPARTDRTTGRGNLSPLTWVSIVLVVIGALNWALIGLFRFNLVGAIFGDMSTLSRIIYTLVGLAGLYLIFDAFRMREGRGAGTPSSVTP